MSDGGYQGSLRELHAGAWLRTVLIHHVRKIRPLEVIELADASRQ